MGIFYEKLKIRCKKGENYGLFRGWKWILCDFYFVWRIFFIIENIKFSLVFRVMVFFFDLYSGSF